MSRTGGDGDEVHAVPSPALDSQALDSLVAGVRPLGIKRGLLRWRERLPGLVWNDASLEGNPFTEPDVVTLLDGGAAPRYDDHDTQQVLDLSRAAAMVQSLALVGPTDVSDRLSSALNATIAAHEIIEPGVLRGEGYVGGDAVVSMRGIRFVALPGGPELRAVFDESMERANSSSHPLARGAAWAALAAYHQFYSNGNKRTARYVMNTVLLSHGFDAILTPVALKTEYNDALRDMYISGDVTGYAAFLIGLYDDSHITRAGRLGSDC